MRSARHCGDWYYGHSNMRAIPFTSICAEDLRLPNCCFWEVSRLKDSLPAMLRFIFRLLLLCMLPSSFSLADINFLFELIIWSWSLSNVSTRPVLRGGGSRPSPSPLLFISPYFFSLAWIKMGHWVKAVPPISASSYFSQNMPPINIFPMRVVLLRWGANVLKSRTRS